MATPQDLDALNAAMDQALTPMSQLVSYTDPSEPMSLPQTMLGGAFALYVLWSQFFSKDARDARAARMQQDMTLDQARKILGDDMVEMGHRLRERNVELEALLAAREDEVRELKAQLYEGKRASPETIGA